MKKPTLEQLQKESRIRHGYLLPVQNKVAVVIPINKKAKQQFNPNKLKEFYRKNYGK
jgi:hypothetical protein